MWCAVMEDEADFHRMDFAIFLSLVKIVPEQRFMQMIPFIGMDNELFVVAGKVIIMPAKWLWAVVSKNYFNGLSNF